MKRIYSVAPFCIVFLVLSAFIFSNLSAHYEVTGVLVDADQNPVAGLSVILFNENEEQIASDQTDGQGRFTLIYQAEAASADPINGPEMPAEFKLGSSYPNPFNPRTTVPFYAPKNTRAVITVHNILGQEVMRTGADVSAGSHEIQVNLGGRVSQGQYILRVQGDGFSLAQSLTFVSAGIGGGNPEITVRPVGRASPSIPSIPSIPSNFHQINNEPIYRIVVPESQGFSGLVVEVPARVSHDLGTLTLVKKNVCPDGFVCIMDIDGNLYKTVVIGEQVWMAQNLRVSRYRDGTDIASGLSDIGWWSTRTGAYAIYPYTYLNDNDSDEVTYGIDSDEKMANAYGKLYNWHAVDDPRGLCPDGWHVPTELEWMIQLDYLGGPDGNGGKLKATRTDPDPHPRWESPNSGANDETGFSALPAGHRNREGLFWQIGETGFWWTSTVHDLLGNQAWMYLLNHDDSDIATYHHPKEFGFSVRCLRNEDK